jgi:hypothetical protein
MGTNRRARQCTRKQVRMLTYGLASEVEDGMQYLSIKSGPRDRQELPRLPHLRAREKVTQIQIF